MKQVECSSHRQVSLVAMTDNHVAKTFTWVSNPNFRSVFLLRGEVTWEGHCAYFSRVFHDSSQKVYAILYEGEHVGNCGIKHLDRDAQSGELWIYVGSPAMRGKGIGYSAIQLLMQEGTHQLGLKKMVVHLVESNEAAKKLYLRAGFVAVGEAGKEWQGRDCKVMEMVWERDRK